MKKIKKLIALILTLVMIGSLTTNTMAYQMPEEYLEDGQLFNTIYPYMFTSLRTSNANAVIETKAIMIFKYLKSIGVKMSKDEIYKNIMELDKDKTYTTVPNCLDKKIYCNLTPIIVLRQKIDKKEKAKVVYQYPEMPNGCEITSGTILLNWMGYNVDKMTMHNDYLPKYPVKNGVMPNPEEYYIGDARGNAGWYCFEQPIVTALNTYLTDVGDRQRVKKVIGLNEEKLDVYMKHNIPLVIWMTIDYKAPRYGKRTYQLTSGESYTPYTNLHCVVLTSRNEDGSYNIADPIIGDITLTHDIFWYVFEQMGSRAVTIDCDNLIL